MNKDEIISLIKQIVHNEDLKIGWSSDLRAPTKESIYNLLLQYFSIIPIGFAGGGSTGSASDVIEYIDITLTTGNATDKGDLTVAREGCPGVKGLTYGFFCGGHTGGGYSNVIDYINLTTTAENATDRGDLTVARAYFDGGSSGITYGFIGGGYTGAASNVIDYVDTSLTSGNATDRGDLTVSRHALGGVSSNRYGCFAGGWATSNVIDVIDTIIISGNSSDRGDLTTARDGVSGAEGEILGLFIGGKTGGADNTATNVIDYIDLRESSAVNAVDKGDLTVARSYPTGLGGGDLWLLLWRCKGGFK